MQRQAVDFAWRESDVAPLRDCAGPQGFAELLNALGDADHPGHEEVCEWLGDYVPESFSADEINRRLRRREN
jgi:hypothetical protein